MEYKCDIEFLEQRLKLLKWLNYGFIIPCLVTLYFKPTIFVVNGSFTTGLVICALIMYVLRFIDKHYGNALHNHRSDIVIVNNVGVEFCHQDSGYNFKRNHEEIVSVEYSKYLGTPKVKLRIDKHYGNALHNHRSDIVIVNNVGVEFCHQDSGYNFKRNHEEIVSVEYSKYLGTPKVKLRFSNNEFYDLVWFKDSNSLYSKLKREEHLVKKA
ncbi:hypothetical protein K6U31_06155 [Vibrio fluvialis]|nr:hypothetical protein [Vibrio fluvialis]MCG6362589.1 hypothetical protein [Vibrio fluvialis]